jgi:hypothetical protein
MSPEEEIRRAGRAKEVLNNEIFKEAVETVENVYLSGIRNAGFTDTKTREKFALRYACLHDVLAALQSVIETGELAEQTLAQKVKGFLNIN